MTTTITIQLRRPLSCCRSRLDRISAEATELVKIPASEKVGAEIISFKKWDERRLAYEIKGNKRGLYFLCYFNLPAAEVDRHLNGSACSRRHASPHDHPSGSSHP